jgi:hypothetical protein
VEVEVEDAVEAVADVAAVEDVVLVNLCEWK